MADATTTKVALAGLLHDIGKFAQGCIKVSAQYKDNNSDIYQPTNKDGRPSHQHALYTAAFIEQKAHLMPTILADKNWGEGDIFLNLAASHHKPETPLQWIITMADRISSGQDRATFESGESIAWQDFKKTRLLPLLECLGPERVDAFNLPSAFKYRYPLAPLAADTIYPVKASQLDKKDAQLEYQKLFDDFVEKLAEIWHRDSNVSLWIEHLDSLLMTYTSMIPAARVGDVVHDVSLYDHSRTTAAFAAALYLYHQGTGSLNETAIKKSDTGKFLLVSGDFYGIQNFIFSASGEGQSHRSKILRGRSFAVSIFSELAADLLCREMGLSPLAVVVNAAGKFHLIAPNIAAAHTAIAKVRQEINHWLFTISYGQSSMGITATAASPDDFHSQEFRALWDRHLQGIEQQKFHKVDLDQYGGAVPDFLDQFDNTLKSPLCPLCGKRPAVRKAENDRTIYRDEKGSACAICRDHILMGTNLVKGKRLAVCDPAMDLKKDKCLLEPIFGRYQLTFTSDPLEEAAKRGKLFKLWELQVKNDGSLDCRTANRLINGHIPTYQEADNNDNCLLSSGKSEEKTFDLIDQIKEGVPKTFGHIAIKARHWDPQSNRCLGTEALAVLKADVDRLGMLFACGLPDERFTLSRLATMSRQVNNFFSLYLPHLLEITEEFSDVYTVFAGGDDLFLIGPWNRMAALALFLRERFAAYVGQNPTITFSAGITAHKSNTPVNRLAAASEEALEHAKDEGRNRVTMFDETVTWDDFTTLLDKKIFMDSWLERKLLSRSMLYRFNHLINLAEKEQKVTQESRIEMADMECLKWPAMFRYSLARNIDKRLKGEERERAITEVVELAQWLKTHRGAVRIPLWHILYEIRR